MSVNKKLITTNEKPKEVTLFSEKCRMIFGYNGSKYVPKYYDVKEKNEKMSYKKIQKGSMHWFFIAYCKFALRTVNKMDGEMLPGYLELYQYLMAFEILDCAKNLRSEDLITAIARQSKFWIV